MGREQGETDSRRPRLRWWAIAVCWVAGVAAYWWYFVPAIPDRVITLGPNQALAGYTADGSLVIATGAALGLVSADFAALGDTTGPFEVIDPLSGEQLSTVGNETWALSSEIDGSDHVVIESHDQREVINLKTGRTVFSRPDHPDDYWNLSKDGRSLAIATGERVSMIDVETGKQLWSREFPVQEPVSKKDENLELQASYAVPTQHGRFTRVDFETRGLSSPLLHAQDGYGRDRLWLNSRTGETESRFHEVMDLVESPDGRFVLLHQRENCELLSLSDNRVIFWIPSEIFQYEFNRDSTEVRQLAVTHSGLKLSRWSTRDGSPVGKVATDRDREQLDGCLSEDGRLFAAWESDWGLLGSNVIPEALSALGATDLFDFLMRVNETAVQRTAGGWKTHLLARHSTSSSSGTFPNVSVTPIGRADHFAVTLPGRALIFRFDPPRNWWWLTGWGLGPVMLGMAVVRWRKPSTPV
jgi:hypothetical protein